MSRWVLICCFAIDWSLDWLHDCMFAWLIDWLIDWSRCTLLEKVEFTDKWNCDPQQITGLMCSAVGLSWSISSPVITPYSNGERWWDQQKSSGQLPLLSALIPFIRSVQVPSFFIHRTRLTHPDGLRARFGLTDTRNAVHGSGKSSQWAGFIINLLWFTGKIH